ncbi:MAG: flavodoxin-dependent (E)-4-hydroxy-3-methylbut-2-enyl-diphosphate synthase, partial [Bacteroidota bacterium]|nr:flavodoxin-dependent (E)-4-hydroxy-3-methylbut-2-enyl-diphosphate synthase [Bacteroidota bacterium]
FQIPGTLGLIYPAPQWKLLKDKTRCYPLIGFNEYTNFPEKSSQVIFVTVTMNDLVTIDSFSVYDPSVVFVLETKNDHGMAEQRRMFIELKNRGVLNPVIIKRNYTDLSEEQFQLHSATDTAALLLDGFGDGLWFSQDCTSPKNANATAFGVLQATRTRISKTEYISCPSCGRTLFDLQETTAKIRSRTDHLKGVKIGIMGCIVNGPGEMADADYGYVGTGIGKITLYKGREVVERNIKSEGAVDALISLIKKHGDWVEKE